MNATINNTGITPIQDQVLVRRDQAETKTRSGLLYYPEGSYQWKPTGVVIAIGPKVIDRGLLGKRVLFSPQAAVGKALIPDDREVDVRDAHPERLGVVVLNSGDVPREVAGDGPRAASKQYLGDIIGIIEVE